MPSRLVHPTNFESDLQRLKSWRISNLEKSAVPAITSEAIQFGILGLAELYNSVQITEKQIDAKLMEESLSGSVDLLDICSAIREVFQMMRENVQSLQSALRRKGLDSTIQTDLATYFCFRKRMNKSIAKTMKKVKSLEHTRINVNESALRELAGIAVAIFRSILVFLSSPMTGSRGWSLVSKLMMNVKFDDHDVNEVADVEFGLSSFHGKMRSGGAATVVDVQMMQKGLSNLDAVVGEFEGRLERLFRQLVRTRVTLLNVLTDHH